MLHCHHVGDSPTYSRSGLGMMSADCVGDPSEHLAIITNTYTFYQYRYEKKMDDMAVERTTSEGNVSATNQKLS